MQILKILLKVILKVFEPITNKIIKYSYDNVSSRWSEKRRTND